jgi:DNA-directed RNA polymerase sigma subunit (sigma70/sigma32)
MTSRITPRAMRRMKQILAWRKKGKTLKWIGLKLKVTKERVRQIQKLAEHLRSS